VYAGGGQMQGVEGAQILLGMDHEVFGEFGQAVFQGQADELACPQGGMQFGMDLLLDRCRDRVFMAVAQGEANSARASDEM
jgi:hypothetical protein